jgi:hypothetical protein
VVKNHKIVTCNSRDNKNTLEIEEEKNAFKRDIGDTESPVYFYQ